MRISVVVPFRNAERHVARCFDALVHQEPFGGDHEIIAVQDRSTDRSAEIVRGFPRVRLLSSGAPATTTRSASSTGAASAP